VGNRRTLLATAFMAAAALPCSLRAGVQHELIPTLDPFYTRHVTAGGLLISSSPKVDPRALAEAAHLVRRMLAKRPDVLKALVAGKVRVGVMAYNEMTTDLPECRRMSPWWDKRARGLGGNPVTCAEENLLAYRGDPYRGESIFLHEFAHIVHGRGMRAVDETFQARLTALFEGARNAGRFRGYGMTNAGEFWAEGAQSWFDCNRAGGLAVRDADGKRWTEINTREEMKKHLPDFAAFLDRSFGRNPWTYVPVARRLDQPHLRGYDPAKAPVFRWPQKVLDAYNRIEAEKRKKRQAR